MPAGKTENNLLYNFSMYTEGDNYIQRTMTELRKSPLHELDSGNQTLVSTRQVPGDFFV